MSDQVPHRWLRAFLHPRHALEQIEPNMTFSGGLGYKTRDVLWLPLTLVHLMATGVYGGVLVVLIGYPLHWRWVIAKVLRERRERRRS